MDLGNLGPKEPTTVAFHWNPLWHVIPLLPLLVVAALALLPWNRNKAAWLLAFLPAAYAIAAVGREIMPAFSQHFAYLNMWPDIMPLVWMTMTAFFLAGGLMSGAKWMRAVFGGVAGLIFGLASAFVSFTGLTFPEASMSIVMSMSMLLVCTTMSFVIALVASSLVTAVWARGGRRVLPRFLPVFLVLLYILLGLASYSYRIIFGGGIMEFGAILLEPLVNMKMLGPFIVLATISAVKARKRSMAEPANITAEDRAPMQGG